MIAHATPIRYMSVEQVHDSICRLFEITPDELRLKQHHGIAKRAFVASCRRFSRAGYQEISTAWGRRCHSSSVDMYLRWQALEYVPMPHGSPISKEELFEMVSAKVEAEKIQPSPPTTSALEETRAMACKLMLLSEEDYHGGRLMWELAHRRHAVMYAIRVLTGVSFPEIGRDRGDLGWTCAHDAFRRVEACGKVLMPSGNAIDAGCWAELVAIKITMAKIEAAKKAEKKSDYERWRLGNVTRMCRLMEIEPLQNWTAPEFETRYGKVEVA